MRAKPLRTLGQESRAGSSLPQPDARPPPFTLTARLACTRQEKDAVMAEPKVSEQHGSRIIAALEHAWAAIQDQHPDVPGVVIVTGAGSNQKGTPEGYQLRGHHWPERWVLGGQDQPRATTSPTPPRMPPKPCPGPATGSLTTTSCPGSSPATAA